MLSLNKLKNKIWIYLIIFTGVILVGLWFFQFIFRNTYYEVSIKHKLDDAATELLDSKNELPSVIDKVAYNNDICIEVVDRNASLLYSSNYYYKGCLEEGNRSYILYKNHFISSGSLKKTYLVKNTKSNTNTLIKAVKKDHLYIFLNASLEPISATTTILNGQFRYVIIIILILSIFVSYFLSVKISKPILKINKSVKEMAKGNYQADFDYDGNIEEIKELSTDLENAAKELDKTESLRREFLANVSHDLKTPLTMIKAYAEMVRDVTYNDEGERNRDLNIIIEETDRLNFLVNDILELSKLQANTIKLEYETFDLDLLIKNVIHRYDILVTKGNYDIVYEGIEEIFITADKKRVEQILYNLINNAIQYTGDDKKVMIIMKKREEKIRIEVIDTGKGIDKKELPNIWNKYYKIDKSHKRETTVGSGIGLSIVKSACENHGFSYGVESKKGKGSTFWVEI